MLLERVLDSSKELTESLLARHGGLAASEAAVLDAEESRLAVVVLVADLALLLAPDGKTGAGGCNGTVQSLASGSR